MKKLSVILFCCIVFIQNTNAQFFSVSRPGLWNSSLADSVRFDNGQFPGATFQTGGLWQIGTPEKTNFVASWSPSKALMTDSASVYGTSVDQSVVFTFPINFVDQFINPAISFIHRLDIAAGDTAFFEVSTDSLNWISPLEMSNINGSPVIGSIYNTNPQTGNSSNYFQNFFTDTLSAWIQTSVWLDCFIPLKDKSTGKVYFRFRFKSDNNSESRDGWMIDNLYFITYSLLGGIEDENTISVNVFPNPVSENKVNIISKEEIESLDLFSIDGIKVYSDRNIQNNTVELPQTLSNGLYQAVLHSKTGKSGHCPIILLK